MERENKISTINVNFNEITGKIKPMHAVNNGPVYKFNGDQRITNLEAYREAGIPYTRNHDASFYAIYGGEHTVDVNLIFRDFSKDPYDPESYDFVLTDEYLRVIDTAGAKVFYRLGAKIEHEKKKYNTLPPADFKKWAVICEHIIRHYTEGWADGFHYDIEYWEIWNEPDLDETIENKRTWGGTRAQFFELYHIAATHLKACFPHLKIGGPALAWNLEWAEDFIKQLKAPLDFFSWHVYSDTPEKFIKMANRVREILDENGFSKTESILNEWNFVKDWANEDWIYSLKSIKSIKGAAFTASIMCESQRLPIDMLMYYDARPCGMNGMFNTDFVCELLKGYYPFKAFNSLYVLGNEVKSASDADDFYVCAAKNDDEAAVMVCRSTYDTKSVRAKINFEAESGVLAEFYLLDEDYDLELVREEEFSGEKFTTVLEFKPDSMYLIKLKKI